MITITRKFNFCYSHHISGTAHDHNAMLEVTITKWRNPLPTDENYLKKLVTKHVIDILNNQHINLLPVNPEIEQIGELRKRWGKMIATPTAENMVKWISLTLEYVFGSINLIRVRLYETQDCWVEWTNEIGVGE